MLILASASPRRRELLSQAGFSFEVYPAHIPEVPLPGEEPIAYVTRLALEKAQAIFAENSKNLGAPSISRSLRNGGESINSKSPPVSNLVVLGADTTVTLDEHILGKPEDAADAARMLRLLSGRTHRVMTGVAVISAEGSEADAEVTTVRFRALTEEEIAAYIVTGEPMDKAGAYAIQGRAARWIPRIEGCYFNVVGLPIARVAAMLEGRL
jgi:septum formation protein